MRTIVMLGLSVLLFGCGDDGSGLRIQPFSSGSGGLPLTLLKISKDVDHDLALTLSDKVSKETVVSIKNEYSSLVEVTPAQSVTFSVGERKKDVTFRGLSETAAAGVPIVFVLEGTDSSVTLNVAVEDPYATGG